MGFYYYKMFYLLYKLGFIIVIQWGFVVTFPYIHMLYTSLFHPLHYSPSLPYPLLK
jgi:hypothetical protein